MNHPVHSITNWSSRRGSKAAGCIGLAHMSIRCWRCAISPVMIVGMRLGRRSYAPCDSKNSNGARSAATNAAQPAAIRRPNPPRLSRVPWRHHPGPLPLLTPTSRQRRNRADHPPKCNQVNHGARRPIIPGATCLSGGHGSGQPRRLPLQNPEPHPSSGRALTPALRGYRMASRERSAETPGAEERDIRAAKKDAGRTQA